MLLDREMIVGQGKRVRTRENSGFKNTHMVCPGNNQRTWTWTWQDERWGWKTECRPNVPASQRSTRRSHTQRMGFDISD